MLIILKIVGGCSLENFFWKCIWELFSCRPGPKLFRCWVCWKRRLWLVVQSFMLEQMNSQCSHGVLYFAPTSLIRRENFQSERPSSLNIVTWKGAIKLWFFSCVCVWVSAYCVLSNVRKANHLLYWVVIRPFCHTKYRLSNLEMTSKVRLFFLETIDCFLPGLSKNSGSPPDSIYRCSISKN